MNIPGFAAEASLYKAETCYQDHGRPGTSDPKRTITTAFDPCPECRSLSGCARAQCYCTCGNDPGYWMPGNFGPHSPCGICF